MLFVIAINYLLENCYFNVGIVTMKQATGIPMVLHHAPFWAKLFLYASEELYTWHY